MNEEEMRYRVSAVVTSTLQIVVQARSAEEAEAFSDAIDFDKWSVLSTEYETVDVSKDFFESKNKVEQDADFTTSNQGPTLKIVNQILMIDISFNFYSDSGGKDPDSHSPTLKKYHKLLWNKPLPNGKIFTLADTDTSSYLTYKSEREEIALSSDSISNSYRDKKSLSNILKDLTSEVEKLKEYTSVYTIDKGFLLNDLNGCWIYLMEDSLDLN